MAEFDKNAAYLWAIIGLGLAVPLLMTVFAILRTHFAKRRLHRLEQSEEG